MMTDFDLLPKLKSKKTNKKTPRGGLVRVGGRELQLLNRVEALLILTARLLAGVSTQLL